MAGGPLPGHDDVFVLRALIAAAATHQDTTKSSVGSGCDGDHGAATADPATAGASTEGAAPKDTTKETP